MKKIIIIAFTIIAIAALLFAFFAHAQVAPNFWIKSGSNLQPIGSTWGLALPSTPCTGSQFYQSTAGGIFQCGTPSGGGGGSVGPSTSTFIGIFNSSGTLTGYASGTYTSSTDTWTLSGITLQATEQPVAGGGPSDILGVQDIFFTTSTSKGPVFVANDSNGQIELNPIGGGGVEISTSGIIIGGVTANLNLIPDLLTTDRTQEPPDENGVYTLGGNNGVTGDCAKWSDSNTLTDAGSACGSGGGGATTTINKANGPTFNFTLSTGTMGIATSTSGGSSTVAFTVPGNLNAFTNGPGYITTSTNLTTANFSSANISQWTNNSGYITTSTNNFGGLTNASITAVAPITWSAESVIGFNTSTPLTLSGQYTFNATTTIHNGTTTGMTSSTNPLLAIVPQAWSGGNASGSLLGTNVTRTYNGALFEFMSSSTDRLVLSSSGVLLYPNVKSALELADSNGNLTAYAGSSDPCGANSAPTTLSATGALGGCTSAFLTGTKVDSANSITGAVIVAGTSPITVSSSSQTITVACATCNTSSLSGSGSANQLTFWGGTNNLTSVASMTYNSSTGAFNIGATSTFTGAFTQQNAAASLASTTVNGNATTTSLTVTGVTNLNSTTTVGTGAINQFIVNPTNTKSYVAAGSSTLAATIGGTLAYSVSSTGNNAGASTSIATFSIPTSTFLTPGDEIDAYVGGTYAASANTNKQVQVQVSSTIIFDTGAAFAPANTACNWFVESRGTEITVSSTIWVSQYTDSCQNALTDDSGDAGNKVVAASTTAPININVYGNGTSGSDVVANYFRVLYAPF